DRGYLRHQKAWRREVAAHAPCPVAEVEADAVVPVALASVKAEWAARTIRPRLHAHLDEMLVPLAATPLARTGGEAAARGIDLADVDRLLGRLDIDRSVPPVPHLF